MTAACATGGADNDDRADSADGVVSRETSAWGAAGPPALTTTRPDVVSRETSAATPPPSVALLFPAAVPRLVAYADLLAGDGVRRGLIGPREVPRLWQRHLLNCAVIEAAIPPQARVVDVGSGAGLPGVVLALVRPDLHVVLLDAQRRRVDFLVEALRTLALGNAEVRRGRAEEVPPLGCDVATARAVAPLGQLAGWTVRHVRPGGTVLAIKGAGVADEVAAAGASLRRLGVAGTVVLTFGADVLTEPTTVVRLTLGDRLPGANRHGRHKRPSARRRRGAGPVG